MATGKFRNLRQLAAAVVMAGALAGCANSPSESTDDKLSRLLVAPDKYVLYNCQQLAQRGVEVTARQKVLLALIAKAGDSPDGRLVSATSYRPDYIEMQGDLNELRATSRAKRCKTVPGEEKPTPPQVKPTPAKKPAKAKG